MNKGEDCKLIETLWADFMSCNQPLRNNTLFSFGERQNQKASTKFSVFEDVHKSASFRPNQGVAVISTGLFSTTGNYNCLVCDHELYLDGAHFRILAWQQQQLFQRGFLHPEEFCRVSLLPWWCSLLAARCCLRHWELMFVCLSYFGLVSSRHQTCHVKQHFKEKRLPF